MLIPKELTRQHIMVALERISQEGVPRQRASTKFCVVHDGRHFPPKYVISVAGRALVAEGLHPSLFSGGNETNQVLRDLGFAVVECNCGGLMGPARSAASSRMI